MTPSQVGVSRRRAIVEAAARVFAADGYSAGSLNTIAREVGISRQLLLHYFPRKAALLEAVIDQHEPHAPWQDAARLPLAAFLADIDRLFSLEREDRERTRLSHRLRTEAADARHPAHGWVTSTQQQRRQTLLAVYAGAIERGELPPDTDPAALVVTTMAAVDGIERQQLAEPGLNGKAAVESVRRLLAALSTTARDPSRPAQHAQPDR